jgi:2',5'-phosphodiesterase
VHVQDVFKRPLSARHAQFADMLDASPDLELALQKVATIAQMVLLVPRAAAAADDDDGSNAAAAGSSDGRNGGSMVGVPAPVLMINTHLFFHPYAPHIRTLHTAAILEEAAAALAALQQQQQQQQQLDAVPEGFTKVDKILLQQLGSMPPPTILFCGDLNSDLNDGVPGVIELLQTGRLAADHWDWKMGAAFKWGKDEEDYAAEQQQQQQEAEGVHHHQQQQQHVVADGHDFDPPAESPTRAVQLYGKDVSVPFVLRR